MTEIMPSEGFVHGVSTGCGEGAKEIDLLKSGVVQRFDLYEISKTRIDKCLSLADKFGVADRINIRQVNAFDEPVTARYDLVYWNNALHHMLDVSKAIQWSFDCLQVGGGGLLWMTLWGRHVFNGQIMN